MKSQYSIQKNMEQNFRPRKNDKYLKEIRYQKYEDFLNYLLRENSLEEFKKWLIARIDYERN